MSAPATSDLGRRWLTAADWQVVAGGALRTLVGRPGMARLGWFDGGLGFLTLTAEDGRTEADDPSSSVLLDAVADLLRPCFEHPLHGLYHVGEHGTYRWTAYLAPASPGRFVAAYTTHVDDHWELRVAEIDRLVAGGLVVDLCSVWHRLAPTDRIDARPEGSGTSITVADAVLDALVAHRNDREAMRAEVDALGWDAGLADALVATFAAPLIEVEVQTAARLPDDTPSIGQHELWLSTTGWTWRLDREPGAVLLTRYGPMDALDTVRDPLRWLDPEVVR